MGKQLKTTDILGELAKEEPAPSIPPSTPPVTRTHLAQTQPVSPSDLEMNIQALKAQAEAAAIGKPSPYQSDLRAKLRDKTQFNFSQIPTFIVKEFEALQKAAGMNKKEYLYHLLRKEGADIPPYEEMDGRKL